MLSVLAGIHPGTDGGVASAQTRVVYPDWLSPSTAGRPEWDPYGPGTYTPPTPDQPPWDPYAPSVLQRTLAMTAADPVAQGLAVQGNLRTANRLYIERGGALIPEGAVILGEPFDLWAYVGYYGSFVLYDGSDRIFTRSNALPGWYRISGLASEILYPHRYRFVAAGISSNEVPVRVDSGGYPTTYGLTGRVVDESGRGIPGATVRITGTEGGSFSTVTNTLGYYGFDLPTGIYTVTAELPGYTFTPSTGRVWTGTVSAAQIIVGYRGTSLPASIGAGSAYLSGSTGGLGWVEGRVIEQGGAGIAGAAISVDGLLTSTATDSAGVFRTALLPGTHRIDAERPGYGILPEAVLVRAGATSQVILIAKRSLVLGSAGTI